MDKRTLALLEALPLRCGVVNGRGVITWANPAALSSRVQLVGQPAAACWPAWTPTPGTTIEHGNGKWFRVTRVAVGRELVCVGEDLTELISARGTGQLIEYALRDPFAVMRLMGIDPTTLRR